MSSSERESHEFRGWNSRDAITSRHDFLTSLATWWNENVPRENLYLCRIFLNTYFYFTEVKLTFLWVNRVLRSVHWNNYLRSRKVNLCEIFFFFKWSVEKMSLRRISVECASVSGDTGNPVKFNLLAMFSRVSRWIQFQCLAGVSSATFHGEKHSTQIPQAVGYYI